MAPPARGPHPSRAPPLSSARMTVLPPKSVKASGGVDTLLPFSVATQAGGPRHLIPLQPLLYTIVSSSSLLTLCAASLSLSLVLASLLSPWRALSLSLSLKKLFFIGVRGRLLSTRSFWSDLSGCSPLGFGAGASRAAARRGWI